MQKQGNPFGFNEARAFSAGNLDVSEASVDAYVDASMRPAHSAREILIRACGHKGPLQASMRPAHSAREIFRMPSALDGACGCFNEARAFSAGNPRNGAAERPQDLLASMRPAHSAREIASSTRPTMRRTSSFNEARAFSAGNRLASRQEHHREWSFNEARAFSAGNQFSSSSESTVYIASMRPAHSAREILDEIQPESRNARASMRPAHSAREIRGLDRRPRSRIWCFNEARAFSAGNRPASPTWCASGIGFNEARAFSAGNLGEQRGGFGVASVLQ